MAASLLLSNYLPISKSSVLHYWKFLAFWNMLPELLLHQNNKFIYASSISVADHFIIYIQVLETYPTKPRNLALQDSCQTILTYNPIHSNESMNSTNLSNRKNLVAITDEHHRRKERCLAFKKVKEEGICNLKRELSVCIM